MSVARRTAGEMKTDDLVYVAVRRARGGVPAGVLVGELKLERLLLVLSSA